MSLLESVISIILIGIIVTIFSFVPSGIMQNEYTAKQVLTSSNVMDEVAFEVEQTDWALVSDTDMEINTIINRVETKIESVVGGRFALKGEVVTIETKPFIKVTVSHGQIEHEYFYGFSQIQ